MASAPTTRTSKVFVDSSVVIAAAISEKGAARGLVLASFRGAVALCTSPLVFEETERNLWRKAPSALPAYQTFRAALLADVVRPSKTAVLRAAKIVDLKDAPIVAGAVRAAADYPATYDRKHLLAHKDAIKSHFGVLVVVPDEVMRAIKGP